MGNMESTTTGQVPATATATICPQCDQCPPCNCGSGDGGAGSTMLPASGSDSSKDSQPPPQIYLEENVPTTAYCSSATTRFGVAYDSRASCEAAGHQWITLQPDVLQKHPTQVCDTFRALPPLPGSTSCGSGEVAYGPPSSFVCVPESRVGQYVSGLECLLGKYPNAQRPRAMMTPTAQQ